MKLPSGKPKKSTKVTGKKSRKASASKPKTVPNKKVGGKSLNFP